jgi:hypothetical protein
VYAPAERAGKERNDGSRVWSTGRQLPPLSSEGVFLNKIQTEILRVFLLAIHRHLN